jgi:hypothetical protein
VLGTPSPPEVLDRFQQVWWLIVAGGVLVSLAALALRRPAPAPAPALAPVEAVAVTS